MRRNKKQKKSFVMTLCLLLIVVLGIGYAVLSQQLSINGGLEYGSMKWDVGFKTATDGGGTVNSNPTIADDKKSITITCDIGTSTASETCIANAVIANNSTFDVQLESNPTITYDSTYVKSVDAIWLEDSKIIAASDTIDAESTKEIKISIVTNELSSDMLPSTSLTVPITISMNWVENGSSNREITFVDKTAIFLGDSVAYGYSTGGNGFGYYINNQEAFLSYTNAAVNRATINTTTEGTNNVVTQINRNKDNDYDFVIIEGGYGDLRDIPPLGTISEEYDIASLDTTTFAGAMEYTLYLATTTWEKARVGFIVSYDVPNESQGIRSNYEETKKYWDMAKLVCEKWNVPYLDFFEGSTNYNGEMKTYSEIFQVTTKTYLPDNIHPNVAGYEIITPFIKDWMKTLPIYKANFTVTNVSKTTKISDLKFVSAITLTGTGGLTSGTGRSTHLQNTYVDVNGGEIIGLTEAGKAANVSYSLYEYDKNKEYATGGVRANRWITDNENVILTSNTKYIAIVFKNGDGTTDFTTEQLLLLPSYIEFKDSEDIQTITISDLEFTAGKSIDSNNSSKPGQWIDVTGRSTHLQNTYVNVNGGETIGLTEAGKAANVSYSIYEYTNNKVYAPGGEGASRWITGDKNVILTSNTKYIAIVFKNGDGSKDFTADQLLLLPTYIEFKDSEDIQTITISDLEFTAGKSIDSNNSSKPGQWIDVTGRSTHLQNTYVNVNGGETIGLTEAGKAANVSYSIYEYANNKVYATGGEGASRWITGDENVILTSNTKYIAIVFKNGDGSKDFTADQLLLLPTYIEFKE